MNFDLKIDFSHMYEASVSLDAYPFQMTINPLLLGVLSLSEMVFVICHEIEHIILKHPSEMIIRNPSKDPEIAVKLNIAMDASVNDRLVFDAKEYTFNVLSKPEKVITSETLVDFFRLHFKQLQAFDYYYERIPDMAGKGPNGLIIVVINDNGDQIITAKKRKGMVPVHVWTNSDNADDIESLIKKFVSDVYKGMPENVRSSLPDHQKEILNKYISCPKVSWTHILKRYVGTIPDGQRKTRTRFDRRQPERYDLSGIINNRLIKMIVAIDTSGSMSESLLQSVFAEIFGIIGTRRCEVTVIECDSEIQCVYKAKTIKDVSLEVSGRGGTSYIPVIEYINNNRKYRDAILVYFTDGLGDWIIPRPLTFKNLWVLNDEECVLSLKDPYGEVLLLD